MQPSIFISHGVPDSTIRDTLLKSFLTKLATKLEKKKPNCIIVFSSEWIEKKITISGNYLNTSSPTKHFGYDNIIPYKPNNNRKYVSLLEELFIFHNIDYETSNERGFDFGVNNPLSIIFPNNDIPVIQISLSSNLNEEEHFAIGKKLQKLAARNVLIIGSGNMTENISFSKAIANEQGENSELPHTEDFLYWITEKIQNNDLSSLFKYKENAPYAPENHPKPTALLPLFITLGLSFPEGLKRIHYSNDFAMAVDCYFSKTILK